jgi:hypothetical protein
VLIVISDGANATVSPTFKSAPFAVSMTVAVSARRVSVICPVPRSGFVV